MAKSSKSASRDIKHRITIPERYTDEPADVAGSSSSAIPLLAHPDDYDQDTHDPDEELPGYNDYEGSDNDSPPGFTTYRPVVQKIKTINDILTVSLDPHLNSDGEALYRYILPCGAFFSPSLSGRPEYAFTQSHLFFLPLTAASFYFC